LTGDVLTGLDSLVTDLDAEYLTVIILDEAESLLYVIIGRHLDELKVRIVKIIW